MALPRWPHRSPIPSALIGVREQGADFVLHNKFQTSAMDRMRVQRCVRPQLSYKEKNGGGCALDTGLHVNQSAKYSAWKAFPQPSQLPRTGALSSISGR